MLNKYLPLFQSLTAEETGHVVTRLLERGHSIPPVEDGERLFGLCENREMTQADIVLAMAARSTEMDRVCLEKLIGKPLRKPLPAIEEPHTTKPEPAEKKKRVRNARVDPRVITAVAKNPKKKGSAAHARYKLYRVGHTLDQCVQRGVTRADIRWDMSQGFIKVQSPKRRGGK